MQTRLHHLQLEPVRNDLTHSLSPTFRSVCAISIEEVWAYIYQKLARSLALSLDGVNEACFQSNFRAEELGRSDHGDEGGQLIGCDGDNAMRVQFNSLAGGRKYRLRRKEKKREDLMYVRTWLCRTERPDLANWVIIPWNNLWDYTFSPRYKEQN